MVSTAPGAVLTKILHRIERTGVLAGLPLLVRAYAQGALALLERSTLQVLIVRVLGIEDEKDHRTMA